MKRIVYAMIITTTLLFAGWLFLLTPYTATATAERTFVLNDNFARVKKILTRNNVLAKAVGEDAVTDVSFDSASFVPGNLNLDRSFSLTTDFGNGKETVRFSQKVRIEDDRMEVYTISLDHRYLTVNSHFLVKRSGAICAVASKVILKYTRRIPYSKKEQINDKMQEAADGMVSTTEKVLTDLVDSYNKKSLIIPEIKIEF